MDRNGDLEVQIAWTHDGLSDAEATEVTAVAIVDGFTYSLVHAVGPTRWYITRTGSGVWSRTVVYGSRTAPALCRAWNLVMANSAR